MIGYKAKVRHSPLHTFVSLTRWVGPRLGENRVYTAHTTKIRDIHLNSTGHSKTTVNNLLRLDT